MYCIVDGLCSTQWDNVVETEQRETLGATGRQKWLLLCCLASTGCTGCSCSCFWVPTNLACDIRQSVVGILRCCRRVSLGKWKGAFDFALRRPSFLLFLSGPISYSKTIQGPPILIPKWANKLQFKVNLLTSAIWYASTFPLIANPLTVPVPVWHHHPLSVSFLLF